jgi:hypothetical protein
MDAELRDNVSNIMKNLNIDNYPTYVPPLKQTQVAPSPIPFASLSSPHLAQQKVDLAPPFSKVEKVDSLIPPITHPGYVPQNNGLETGGMLNWTDDLPMGQGAKATFEKVIKHFVDFNKSPEPRIMEVGVFAGTSLIEIVKRIPNSKATAVDRWDSYEEINVDKMKNKEILKNPEFAKALDCLSTIKERKIEDIFHQNVAVAGMQNRIRTLKGDSHAVLMDLVNQKAKFDFIYVDGSHKCLDVALDLFLSWQLLEKGGIMAIDDYLYTMEKDFDVNPLEYPYNAVNHFLDKYKKELVVLEKGYRAFIKKIHLS